MDFRFGIVLTLLVATSFASPTPKPDSIRPLYFDDLSTPRIVGGTDAPANSAPYAVALTTGLLLRSFFCGGSLISAKAVLTAAHCIENVYNNGVLSGTLRGTIGTTQWNVGGTTISFLQNITHSEYDGGVHDIGILITSTLVMESDTVSYVPLGAGYIDADVPVRVTGWGRLVEGGPTTTSLQELYTTTVGANECIETMAEAAVDSPFYIPTVDPELEICTYHSFAHGNCHGDSGSALVDQRNGEQVGVVSWGLPCARGAPDVYVRVSTHFLWIIENTVTPYGQEIVGE